MLDVNGTLKPIHVLANRKIHFPVDKRSDKLT